MLEGKQTPFQMALPMGQSFLSGSHKLPVEEEYRSHVPLLAAHKVSLCRPLSFSRGIWLERPHR